MPFLRVAFKAKVAWFDISAVSVSDCMKGIVVEQRESVQISH
jgi:hypothetical protein